MTSVRAPVRKPSPQTDVPQQVGSRRGTDSVRLQLDGKRGSAESRGQPGLAAARSVRCPHEKVLEPSPICSLAALPIAFRVPLHDTGAAPDHEAAGRLLDESQIEHELRVRELRQIANVSQRSLSNHSATL